MIGCLRVCSFISRRQASSGKSVADSAGYVSYLIGLNKSVDSFYPFPKLLSRERFQEIEALKEPIKRFLKTENNPQLNDERGQFDPKVIDGFKNLGITGLQTPEEYGGLGLTNTEFASALEVVSSDLALAVYMGAHQSIGYKGINLFGNEQQKKKYLPKLASGEHIASYALTEPVAGSDAAHIKSKATLSSDGKHYILNGSKIWISNGNEAEIFTVFANTTINGEDKITAFIVERSFGGITHGPHEKKMGIRGVNSVVVNFDNVKVPVENVLGNVGEGFKVAMEILNSGRFGMGSSMSGCMKLLLEKAIETTSNRSQFGKKLVEFEDIQYKLSVMAAEIYAVESMTYVVSANMDRKISCEIESALLKVFATEAAWNVCDECLQVHGGMGFMSETDIDRVLRDLRIFRIFEGTNDILRQFAFLTTAKRFSKMGNLDIISRTFRKNELPILVDRSSFKKSLAASERSFYLKLVSLLTKKGKKIINDQLICRNMADCMMNLYAMTVILSRFNSSPIPESEVSLAKFAFQLYLTRYDRAYMKLEQDQSLTPSVSEITKNLIDEKGYYIKHALDI